MPPCGSSVRRWSKAVCHPDGRAAAGEPALFRGANCLPHAWTACLLDSRDLVPTHGSRISLISADAADELQRNRSARISPHQPNPRPMGWGMSATLQLVRHALLSNAYLFAKTLGTPSEASRASFIGLVATEMRALARNHSRQLHFKSVFEIGSVRMRLPVAIAIALHSAGTTGGNAGSPRPVGGFSVILKCTSIGGA